MSYKVTPSADSLGLSRSQWKFIQYLTCPQPLPSRLLKLRALQSHSTCTSQIHPTAAQQEAAPEASQEAPCNSWPSLSNSYSVPSLRQPIPQHKFFDKLLKSSVISSISKDLSSLILFFKSVTLIAIVVFACLELIFSLDS